MSANAGATNARHAVYCHVAGVWRAFVLHRLPGIRSGHKYGPASNSAASALHPILSSNLAT